MQSDNIKYKCKKCNGKGYILKPGFSTNKHSLIRSKHPCKHCNEKGELDWIENIVGVKSDFRPKMPPKRIVRH